MSTTSSPRGQSPGPAAPSDRSGQIVAAAVAIVREDGIDAVSVRRVAARAGVGASTLRHYFPTQRDLNEAVAARVLAVTLDDRRIADANLDPVERLVDCLWQFVEGDEAVRIRWLDLVHGAVTHGPDSLPAQLLAGFTATGRARMVAWLDRLAVEGHLDAQDVAGASTALAVRVDGLGLALLLPGSGVDAEGARAMLVDDVTRLLTARRTDRRRGRRGLAGVLDDLGRRTSAARETGPGRSAT